MRYGGQKIDTKRYLYAYTLLLVVVNLVMIATENLGLVDHWLYNSFLILEFLLLSMYFNQISKIAWIKQAILGFQCFFVGICVYELLWLKELFKVNENIKAIGSLGIIGFCLMYFYQLLKLLQVPKIWHDPIFLIAASAFFYFTSNFVFSVFARNILWGNQQNAIFIFRYILLLSIVYFCSLSYAIWNIQRLK